MSQGFCLPQLRFRGVDANGNALAGGLLYAYEAGTSTPLDTYADATMETPNTNPIVLDSQGECTAFIPSGTLYKFDLHDANDTPQSGWPIDNVEATTAAPAAPPAPPPVPTGGIIAYGGSAAPDGYLIADGSAVSRATYSDLFAVIGTTFGAGNGTTTFAVPSLVGRFPLGVAASGTGSTLGGSGGAIDHTHTGPSHTHDVTVTRDGWGNALNNPSVTSRLNVGNSAGTGNLTGSYQPANDLDVTTAAGGTGDTGTANPPYLALTFLIKT